MTSIANVVNVSISETGALARTDNLNLCAVITDSSAVLNSAERYRVYSDYKSLVADFGATAEVTPFASAFFAQSPNPTSVGGRLVVWFWRSATETVAAKAGKLTGATLDVAAVIKSLQAISDGKLAVTVDGGDAQELTSLDFRLVTSLAGVVTVLNAALDDATVSTDGTKIIITSDTTGNSSSLTFATSVGTSGTFVGTLLGLTSGSGAALAAGANSSTLSSETKSETLSALIAAIRVYGACFVDAPVDSADSVAVATWAQANNCLVYESFSNTAYLMPSNTSPVWLNKVAGRTNYRMLFSLAAQRTIAAAYMAKVHTVNFNAENAALTMHLKTLTSVVPETYSQTQLDNAKTVGLDVYTTIKDVGVVLCSGANDFVDNRYNSIGFVEAIQTDLFNLLKSSATKVPQTTKGVNQIVDQCERTTQRFVRAGVFAPGAWTATTFFGDQTTFKRHISEFGFYYLAGSLDTQSAQDRADRKAPVVQGAVKLAGAVHSADIIINVNA